MYGAALRFVDYEDQDSLAQTLADVHTVISVVKVHGEAWAAAQITLL